MKGVFKMKKICSIIMALTFMFCLFPTSIVNVSASVNDLNLLWPIKNYYGVDSGYGIRKWDGKRHNGIDIFRPNGTPIYASMDGNAVPSWHNSWGNNVLIDHGNGYKTRYAHMSRFEFNSAKYVKKGDIIGYVGKSGNAAGYHLHFEIYEGSNRINPVPINYDGRHYYAGSAPCVQAIRYMYELEKQPTVHTHNWQQTYESFHPHKIFNYCQECGEKSYANGKELKISCTECYPLGNLRLTRSFDRLSGVTTFFRNNVSNSNYYILKIFRASSMYGVYSTYTTVNMDTTSYTVTLPQGYYYKATLTAKNLNTSQEKDSTCDSFKIYNTYTVSYNANGGSGEPSPQIKIQDTNLTLSSTKPTKAHYVFKGWSKNKTATEVTYEAGGTYNKNAKVVLYAVWEPETYTVSYDVNGGKGEVGENTITYGDTLKMPNAIIKDKCFLKGWATNRAATNPEYKIGMDYSIDSNLTLYAIWGNATWSGSVATGFAGGDGTEKNPYQISNASELAFLAETVNSQSSTPEYKYYKLTDNINMAYEEWVPIGLYNNSNQYFYGCFDGDGFTISDLAISNANDGYVGLFGTVQNSEIKNTNIVGDISGISTTSVIKAGALAGMAIDSNIYGCHAMYVNVSDISASKNSVSSVACLIGNISGGYFKNNKAQDCYVFLKTGNFDSGILVGYSNTDIEDCAVNSKEDELLGTNATVGAFNFGGIVGYTAKSLMKCSVNSAYLSNTIKTSKDTSIGGIVGQAAGNIDLCSVVFTNGALRTIDGEQRQISIYATGTGEQTIGGIVGVAKSECTISDCKYNGQSIAGNTADENAAIGGLIGQSDAADGKTVSIKGGFPLNSDDLPKKSGYIATWYTDDRYTNKYDFSTKPVADFSLYPKWEKGNLKTHIWDGTSKEPIYDDTTKTFYVTTGEELEWLRDRNDDLENFSGYTISLSNDIYLNDVSNFNEWSDTIKPNNTWYGFSEFQGTLNGNNHKIVGMYSTKCGLIELLYGKIYNVVIEKSMISDGGFIANSQREGEVSGCIIRDSYIGGSPGQTGLGGVSPGSCVGGIVGWVRLENNKSISITDCYNSATIIGNRAGGIVGLCTGDNTAYKLITIKNCVNKGKITGVSSGVASYIGGIAGLVFGDFTGYRCFIESCYNTAELSGHVVGGLVGMCANTQVFGCYNTGLVSGYRYCGGILGETYSSNVYKCYNIGDVTGNQKIGGIAGYTSGSDQMYIQNCYCKQSTCYNADETNKLYISKVSSKPLSYFKNVNNFSLFEYYYASEPTKNSGFMYLKSMEETYKTYTVSIVEDKISLSRCFSNVEGTISSASPNKNAYAGGIIGYGNSGGNGCFNGKNLLAVSDRVMASTENRSYSANSGDIIGKNLNNKFTFLDIYSNSSMDLSASNSANSANAVTETKGASKTFTQIKRESFLKAVFGPATYQSIDYLNTDPTAVWVIRNGELPELYYNVLKNIEISDKIEHGKITTDKSQAVKGEVVSITAIPDFDYELNKIYINGVEISGNTFEVDDETTVYALFTPKPKKYTAKIENNNNVTASLFNADEVGQISLLSASNEITATDGDEIKIATTTNDNFNLDAILVNGEEVVGNSFIVTDDSIVTLDVKNTDTTIKAVTNDADDISYTTAVVSGKMMSENDSTSQGYIRYWSENELDEIYTTEFKEGVEYSVELQDLLPGTTYYYQMTENGDVKSFTTILEESDGETTDEPYESGLEINAEYSKTENGYDITVTSSEQLPDCIGIVGLYNANDTLFKNAYVETGNVNQFVIHVSTDKKPKYIKVFLWNDTYKMNPLCKSKQIEVK